MNQATRTPTLFIIIPCYNEQQVLPITAPLFHAKLSALMERGCVSDRSRILFVNDGSTDETWHIIQSLSRQDARFQGISLSRNCGHQNAVLSGLMEAKDLCDITISIDCDGQDDLDAMDEMVQRYMEGYEVVYGVRSNRESDGFFKRFTAESYYRLLLNMGVEVVYNHADYRLISRRVLEQFADYHEVNLFLRGLVPLIGFPSTQVYYERHERLAGESHYPLSKMLLLAFDGITSLSIKPIRLITGFGLSVVILSIIWIIWSVIEHLLNRTVSGWSSLICIVCFFGGATLLSLGIIGEYVGKTYLETKRRPRYIISESTLRPGNEAQRNG